MCFTFSRERNGWGLYSYSTKEPVKDVEDGERGWKRTTSHLSVEGGLVCGRRRTLDDEFPTALKRNQNKKVPISTWEVEEWSVLM